MTPRKAPDRPLTPPSEEAPSPNPNLIVDRPLSLVSAKWLVKGVWLARQPRSVQLCFMIPICPGEGDADRSTRGHGVTLGSFARKQGMAEPRPDIRETNKQVIAWAQDELEGFLR